MRVILMAGAALIALAPAAAADDLAVGQGPVEYSFKQQPAPGTCHYRTAVSGDTLPDPLCTPGAVSPAVTPDNIDQTICTKGYTRMVRPPVQITEREKKANAKSYGYTGSLKIVEYDHLIPLELGGDPNDPRDLWVQANGGPAPNAKDRIANRLHQMVCDRKIGLREAQMRMATDWTRAI